MYDLPTELLAGIAISLYGFIFALSQPFWGYASDRVGKRKPFILAGLLLMMGATLGFMFADRYLWILVLRGLQGVAVAMILVQLTVKEEVSEGGVPGAADSGGGVPGAADSGDAVPGSGGTRNV